MRISVVTRHIGIVKRRHAVDPNQFKLAVLKAQIGPGGKPLLADMAHAAARACGVQCGGTAETMPLACSACDAFGCSQCVKSSPHAAGNVCQACAQSYVNEAGRLFVWRCQAVWPRVPASKYERSVALTIRKRLWKGAVTKNACEWAKTSGRASTLQRDCMQLMRSWY